MDDDAVSESARGSERAETHNVLSGAARSVVQARTVRDITVINVGEDAISWPAKVDRPIVGIPRMRHLVPRPELTEPIIDQLCRTRNGGFVALTAVAGAGGFGKTTLAAAVCHDSRVAQNFPDGMLWVTIGDHTAEAELSSKINDLVLQLSGRRSLFTDPEQAGRHLGQLLDDKSCLLVIDDVWRSSQLTPFLLGGTRCVRLVTTRVKDSLPTGVNPIVVDAMTATQARNLLGTDLVGATDDDLGAVLGRTGKWPVLLTLANRALRKYVQRGLTVGEAASRLAERLASQGPAAVDINDAGQRNLAVAATLEASLSLLDNGGPGRLERYLELAVFPEDAAIPQEVLEVYWGHTGGVSPGEVEQLCSELDDLSLVQGYKFAPSPALRLHDVIRAYLRHRAGSALVALHRDLLNAYRPRLPQDRLADSRGTSANTAWWELPGGVHYLWDQLWYHLEQAGLTEELNSTACDFRWILASLTNSGPDVVDTFLGVASDPTAAALKRVLNQSSHLFAPFRPESDLGPTVLSRLFGHAELLDYTQRSAISLSRPYLFPDWPLPDTPHPALRRATYNNSHNFIAVSISPDGAWVAASLGDSSIRLINIDGKERRVLRGHLGNVTDLAISPDGIWFASSSADGTVRLWEADGTELGILDGHPGSVYSVAISSDGTWLATAGIDKTVRLWQPDGTELGILDGHSDSVYSVAISPDGTWLATASKDQTVRLWQPDGTELGVLRGHRRPVHAVEISPDGTWLATGGGDNTVRLWGADGDELGILTGHTGSIRDVVISPDGQWLASAGDDCSVRVWSKDGSEVQVLNGHTELVRSVAISPNGMDLISAGDDHAVRFWQAYNTESSAKSENRGVVTDIEVSSTGTWLATTSHSNTIHLWNADGSARGTVTAGDDWIIRVAISSDATWLAAVGAGSTVHLLDADGSERADLVGHEEETWVGAVAISPDDCWLASGGEDHTVRLWSVDGTERACLLGHTNYVSTVAISPSGTWLASGDGDSVIRLWDREGSEGPVLRGHGDWINAVAIGPDDTWLASASRDATIRLWSTDGSELGVLEGHDNWVNDVAISPDGRFVASCGSDKTVRLWNRATLECVAALRTDSRLESIVWFPTGDRVGIGGMVGPYVFNLVGVRRDHSTASCLGAMPPV